MSLSFDFQAKFEFHHGDYEKQCLHALGRKDKAGMVMNNPSQSVFLFMDRQHLQVSQYAEIMSLNPQAASWNSSQQMLCVYLSCRLLKPRPQFSSCAASAFTCPRTSWPAGVWETSRITSAHTCLIEASCSTQPHREKPFPSLLPKPSEANWCTHLHPFPFKRFELVLGSLLFFVTYSFSPPWPEADSVPILFFFSPPPHAPNVLPLLSAIFGLVPPVFFISLPLHSLLTHSSSFVYLNLHEHWFWVVGCSLGAALSAAPVIEGTLYVASKTGTNSTQVFTVVLRWTCFYILVVIRKDC